MEYGIEDSIKTVANLVKVFQGQLALIQLSIGEDFVYDLLSQPLYPRRGRVRQGSRSRFNGVSQHDDSSLFGLGFRPWVAIVFLVDLLDSRILLLLGFLIEVTDEIGSMVLLDNIDDLLSQMVLLGQGDPVLDVGDQNQAAHARREFVVRVLSTLLIFNEIHGFLDLADVVIVCGHLGENRIGIDRLCGGFHKISQNDTVRVSFRGLDNQVLKNRLLRIRQFQEFDVRRVAEANFDDRCDC